MKTRVQFGTMDSRAVAVSVKDIPVGDIEIRENVRKEYTGIDELAESIKQHGLLQPITVYHNGDGYVVKTGHRRFQACKLLFKQEPERFHRIRCIIVSDKKNATVIQLVENVQRIDLSQIDLFNALTALCGEELTHKQIAIEMGKTEGYVKNLFMGINEAVGDHRLKNLLTKQSAASHAGVTIQDIAETKGIPDKAERIKLLEQRKAGKINRAKMRHKIKELKAGNENTPSVELPPGNISKTANPEPEVKMTISPDGLRFKLVFADKRSADLIDRGIRRLLGRHEIKVAEG
jgi:ParB family chromosome partitioning protein